MTQSDPNMDTNLRICIVGSLGQDPSVLQAAEIFQVPVVFSQSGEEFVDDENFKTYFVLSEFAGPSFDLLSSKKCRILGPTALKELALNKEPLPDRIRRLYSLSMTGLAVCFTGFRKKEELCHLANLVHLMGGSIKKGMEYKVTHLVANFPSGDKYQYAITFNLPVLAESWVTSAWENRHVVGYSCKSLSVINEHKLKFGGARVCFLGFSKSETEHMTEVLINNRGVLSSLEDNQCTHIVLDCEETYELIRAKILKLAEHSVKPIREKVPLENSIISEDTIEKVMQKKKIDYEEQKSQESKSLFSRFNIKKKIWELSGPPEFGSYFYDDIFESDEDMPQIEDNNLSFKSNEKMVVDDANVDNLPDVTSSNAYIVKAEWFWTSVQNEICADEKEYLFEDFVGSTIKTPEDRLQSTPLSGSASSRGRKRKRLPRKPTSGLYESPLSHRKRSSSFSDLGLLSTSGSLLDSTVTPGKNLFFEGKSSTDTDGSRISGRYQVFRELVNTETNYVNILRTIISLFKEPLEKMLDDENMILNATETKIIFGNLPPIYEIHSNMLEELNRGIHNWKEDFSVGNIILKYAPEIEKAYPPFINYFENIKETLEQCDLLKPRFHAFLKVRQAKPECGRESLKELLIRPVQRLPSISLLLMDILKQTDEQNPDHQALQQALAAVKQAMTNINEDKRKTEAQLAMFDLFNEIDDCPAQLISSHRSLVAKCECIEHTEVLSSKKGDSLVLLLFNDTLEVCKKRTKTFNTFTKATSLQKMNKVRKQYKHIRLMPLSNIKKVIDVSESEDCEKVFALLCWNPELLQENFCYFTITDDKVNKKEFLTEMCKQMAHTVCTTNPNDFYDVMDPNEVEVDTTHKVSTLGRSTYSLNKAFSLATKAGGKVRRALSVNNFKMASTPRPMRAFGSQGNLNAGFSPRLTAISQNSFSPLIKPRQTPARV